MPWSPIVALPWPLVLPIAAETFASVADQVRLIEAAQAMRSPQVQAEATGRDRMGIEQATAVITDVRKRCRAPRR